jgi:hypothetical protein
MKNKDSETLVAIVVAYRSLGCHKEAAVAAMEELSIRRMAGDPFDFEDLLERQLATVPKRSDSLG